MNVKSLINTKQLILESKLTILLDHTVTKGNHCESAWIDFFRSFLPAKYAVDKGFVFDCKGNISEQIDVIIYDSLYTPLIFGTDAGEKFITAESVYAIFDSKPDIDKENLEYTNKKIESVRSLHRTAREVINAGQKQPARALTKILGGILAVSSINIKNVEEHCKEYKNIDLGCAIKTHTFLIKRNNEKLESVISASADETVLSFFYIILDELYKLGTVAGIDIRDYANETLENIQLQCES